MSLSRRTLALVLALVVSLPAVARAQDPARAQNIVLGFFNKTLDDGRRHNLVDELQKARGGLEYFEWDQMGLPHAGWGSWDQRRVWTAMELTAKTGHRIQFNVTGFSFEDGPKDPRAVDAKVDAGSVGYTVWELSQVRHHRAFWDATDFYQRSKDGSYRKLSAAQLERLGLRYEGPPLADLAAKKGELLRQTPTERVYSVPGSPGAELVVKLAPTGETDAERAARAEALVEEKDALDALAADGIAVAARKEVGTVGGELAFVRDALTKTAPKDVVSGDKTLSLSRSKAGDLVVSGVRTGQVRPDTQIDGSLITFARQSLLDLAKLRARGAAPVVDASGARSIRGERSTTRGLNGLLTDRIEGSVDRVRDGER